MLNFDPLPEKLSEIRIGMDMMIEDSRSGGFDLFHLQVYNRDGNLLAGIVFDNGSLRVSYFDGTRTTFTGAFFTNDEPLRLELVIDFENNLWSASLEDLTLFPLVTFHRGSEILDLGDLSFAWVIRDPSDPGTNRWLFDNLVGVARPLQVVMPVTEAGAPSLSWRTGGAAPWFGQDVTVQEGGAAMQSGRITHGEKSWVETQVEGPGEISFWWKVSSEHYFDYLKFFVTDALRAQSSGPQDWHHFSLQLGEGIHVLRWEYSKDDGVDWGWDIAWLDSVAFVPRAGMNFAGWVEANQLDGAAALATADPAGDGVPNLLKFIHGVQAEESPAGRLARHDGMAGVSFAHWRDAEGVAMNLEASADLVDWFEVPSEMDVVETDGELDWVRLQEVGFPTGAQRFWRLRVTLED